GHARATGQGPQYGDVAGAGAHEGEQGTDGDARRLRRERRRREGRAVRQIVAVHHELDDAACQVVDVRSGDDRLVPYADKTLHRPIAHDAGELRPRPLVPVDHVVPPPRTDVTSI